MCIINHNYNLSPKLTLSDTLFYNYENSIKNKKYSTPLHSSYASFVICRLFMCINASCFLGKISTAPLNFPKKKKNMSMF